MANNSTSSISSTEPAQLSAARARLTEHLQRMREHRPLGQQREAEHRDWANDRIAETRKQHLRRVLRLSAFAALSVAAWIAAWLNRETSPAAVFLVPLALSALAARSWADVAGELEWQAELAGNGADPVSQLARIALTDDEYMEVVDVLEREPQIRAAAASWKGATWRRDEYNLILQADGLARQTEPAAA